MNINIGALQIVFAIFFLFLLALRISMFVGKTSKAQRDEQRLRALEQKVELISRHLNLSQTPGSSMTPPLPAPFETASWDKPSASVDATMQNEVVSLLRAGRKLEAIKLVRTRSSLDLKASKEAVEAIERTL